MIVLGCGCKTNSRNIIIDYCSNHGVYKPDIHQTEEYYH